MIYPVVRPSPLSPLIVPPDVDGDDDDGDNFGNFVLFLDASIAQSMKNYLAIPTPYTVFQKASSFFIPDRRR